MASEKRVSRRSVLRVAGAGSVAALLGLAMTAKGAEKYPALRNAIRAMRDAKDELDAGRRIFGGHRVKAIRLLNDAIEECQAAIDFAG